MPQLAPISRPGGKPEQQQAEQSPTRKGFGSTTSRAGRRKSGSRRRSPALSKADWGPLGKHPDRDAIMARQRLQLPLSGRLSSEQVNQAWKRNAAQHHPDRGGAHDTMQLVNTARDLLLGRDLG
ncbi:MAG: J domain-containing protein [Cyanobacteriota bacterium]|nr:J domain-containing protein [Cyanobacteriota bacterium]